MSRTAIVAIAIVVLVGGGIALLASGGITPKARATDDRDDVLLGKGKAPPTDVSLADIDAAQVRRDGSDLVLEAEMASDVPRQLADQSLAWRWEIYERGGMTWIVSASVDVEPNVSVLATRANYSSSTVNGLLPGKIVIRGSTVAVHLQREKIKGFPAAFDWLLKTSLDGSRVEAKSAIASDRVPDKGFLEVVD